MPVITVVGAGPGLGLSIAKVFGSHGFKVTLISRSQGRLDVLAERLAAAGVETGQPSAQMCGTVLHCLMLSLPGKGPVRRHRCTRVLTGGVRLHHRRGHDGGHGRKRPTFYRLPGVWGYDCGRAGPAGHAPDAGTAPCSHDRGFLDVQIPRMGNYSVAGATLRHWVLTLHEALADKGVYVAHVPIAGLIGKSSPEMEPDTVSHLLGAVHQA